MSEAQQKTVKLLDTKLDAKTIKTITVCAIVMVIAVLIHDGDHIRQALNWGYSIPISLWVLNLTVYVLPVVTLFLARKLNAYDSVLRYGHGMVRFEQRSCRGSIESSTGRPEQQVRDTYGREPAPVRSRLHH